MIEDLKAYAVYGEAELPWAGRVPEHWEVRRAKSSVGEVTDQVDRAGRGDVCVALECVESWSGRLRPRRGAGVCRGVLKRFERDDVLFGKLRPYLAKVARLQTGGVCVSEFLVLRADTRASLPAFLEHQLRVKPLIDVVGASTFGARMPRTNWHFVGNLPLLFPPLHEQAAIVRFLEHATGRIDRAIRAKRRLIALLEEQKQAIIQRAVTRGLDPGVPAKPSGVPWLGDIPRHWGVSSIGRFARVGNGSTPARGMVEYWIGGDYPWLNSSQVNREVIRSADQFVTARALKECHLPRLRPGAVLVALTGQGRTRGRSAVLEIEATVSQHVAFIVPREDVVSAGFLSTALSAAYLQLRASSDDSGSTRGAITCDGLKRFKIPVPPLPEQERLLERAQDQSRPLAAAASGLEREVGLLREYRTRLVADVVTGKLDVRGVAARLPAEAAPEAAELEGDDALEGQAEPADEVTA